MLRRIIVLASAVLVAVSVAALTSACGTTDSWVEARAASGWAAQYADAANRSSVSLSGADSLRLDWVRSVKGDLAAQVSLG